MAVGWPRVFRAVSRPLRAGETDLADALAGSQTMADGRVSVTLLAQRTGYTPYLIRRWCETGKLIATRTPGRQWRIVASAAFATLGRLPPTDPVAQSAPGGGAVSRCLLPPLPGRILASCLPTTTCMAGLTRADMKSRVITSTCHVTQNERR